MAFFTSFFNSTTLQQCNHCVSSFLKNLISKKNYKSSWFNLRGSVIMLQDSNFFKSFPNFTCSSLKFLTNWVLLIFFRSLWDVHEYKLWKYDTYNSSLLDGVSVSGGQIVNYFLNLVLSKKTIFYFLCGKILKNKILFNLLNVIL